MPIPVWISDRALHLNADSAPHARALAAALRAGNFPWLTDAIPSSRAVLVITDPLANPTDSIPHKISDTLANLPPDALTPTPPRTVTIPACYHPSLAQDLEPAAAALGLAHESLADLHASATYHADTLGFSPGFAYLTGLPAHLQLPRKPSPIPRVPPGSVAFADAMTAVYPHATPGGWHLIARTPLPMFDPQDDPPNRIAPGDTVRFQPITLDEFHDLAKASETAR